jgi:glycosidase
VARRAIRIALETIVRRRRLRGSVIAMSSPSPLLLEVYTRQWLSSLSRRKGREIDLWGVPEEEIDGWAARGFTHLWLMGVWPTGAKSRAEAFHAPELRRAYDEALPGWTDSDVGGSPYAISAYHVPPALGGDEALKAFRKRLAERGLKLVLDFVPNHTGLDHVWAIQRPHLYVGAPVDAGIAIPDTVRVKGAWGERVIAHGKDPYFPGWTDTLQIDHRRPEARRAMIEQLEKIAARCDGVRCDMAMLVLRDVFAKTWAHVPVMNAQGQPIDAVDGEFWSAAIGAVRARHPDFLFLAEAYWDLEDRLIELGFDYAYDKKLYDLVMHEQRGAARHLRALGPRNRRRAHFLENHDEPRAHARLPFAAHRSAALLTLALPGLRFLHDGQLEGRRRFARIQLGRRMHEDPDPAVVDLYDTLVGMLPGTATGRGDGHVVDVVAAWPGNDSHDDLTVIQWQVDDNASAFDVVVVNHAEHRAQGYARLSARGLAGGIWRLVDVLGHERYERAGDELGQRGLYLDVAGHAAQLFRFAR